MGPCWVGCGHNIAPRGVADSPGSQAGRTPAVQPDSSEAVGSSGQQLRAGSSQAGSGSIKQDWQQQQQLLQLAGPSMTKTATQLAPGCIAHGSMHTSAHHISWGGCMARARTCNIHSYLAQTRHTLGAPTRHHHHHRCTIGHPWHTPGTTHTPAWHSMARHAASPTHTRRHTTHLHGAPQAPQRHHSSRS